MKGIVFDIQRASLHDGPGLRTTVFLKGCPLRCAWCHNPESQKPGPETGRSGKIYGRLMTVEEVMEIIAADRAYYESSGGGLTLSGGEPTAQMEFCLALLTAAKCAGFSTCLDTCGHFPERKLPLLLPLVDLWHFDYKVTGRPGHAEWTGVDGSLIARNLESLRKHRARIRLRCPQIPGVNMTPGHLGALRNFAASGDFETVEELPYHNTGNSKYLDLGRESPVFLTPV